MAPGAMTLGALWRQTAARLVTLGGGRLGRQEAAREARLLIGYAMGLAPTDVIAYPERLCRTAEIDLVGSFLERRGAGEPLSRIVGQREFWSLPFKVSDQTLDPRPDSETLVQAATDRLRGGKSVKTTPLKFLDLGTGSGCLLLALLSEWPAAYGLGIDVSLGAITTARENAQALKLFSRADFVVSSWGAALAPTWDIVICNPPYIPRHSLGVLSREVQFDPERALDGGPDGLQAYRDLVPSAGYLIGEKGFLVLEIGMNQGDDVVALARAAGLELVDRRPDLSGIERCLVFGAANRA